MFSARRSRGLAMSAIDAFLAKIRKAPEFVSASASAADPNFGAAIRWRDDGTAPTTATACRSPRAVASIIPVRSGPCA